jgi:hypothetical protein
MPGAATGEEEKEKEEGGFFFFEGEGERRLEERAARAERGFRGVTIVSQH